MPRLLASTPVAWTLMIWSCWSGAAASAPLAGISPGHGDRGDRYGHGDVLAVPGVRKDGARISLEFTIVPLRDGTGQMTGMAAIMRDVTVRFEEMRALRQKLAEASNL